jgi:hypothetical protein
VAVTNATFAHGLSFTPRIYPVILCITNDVSSGINVGTEVSVYSFLTAAGGGLRAMVIACGADGTNIYMNYSGVPGGTAQIAWGGVSAKAFTSFSNFQVKVYY